MSKAIPAPTHLFSPLTQRSVTFPNRIAVSPMCQYCYTDGLSDDWQLVHLGSRAIGGAGIVFTEATAVSPEARITPGDAGLWSDAHIPPLARLTAFIKQQGAVPAIQIAHAGRKASMLPPWGFNGTLLPTDSEPKPVRALTEAEGAWKTVGPSALPYSDTYTTPHEMSREDMQKALADFASTARRAAQAGFLLAEVHAAHGYLAHEFLSPLSNTRTDSYGGSLENRARFPLEIIRTVRQNFPANLPVWVRLSVTDWVDGGLTEDEAITFAHLLKAEDIDLIDCSSGGNSPLQQIPIGPGYQVAFADRIRRETNIPTGAVGMITSPEQADQIIRTHQADIVLLARELLRDPYWPLHAAATLHQSPSYPLQYERASPTKPTRRQPLT